MNFLNSYILISNKKFVQILVLLIFIIFIISGLLNKLDITLTGNDLLKTYQLSKIKDDDFKNISTLILGDSSAGNAINANYFTELSNTNTLNLSLNGSWGLNGSFGILQQSLSKNKTIKNVIIIHTLDIWTREFSKKSIMELFPFFEAQNYLDLKFLLSNLFNPNEIIWHLKYFFKYLNGFDLKRNLDYENDYVLQSKKKYSNESRRINDDSFLDKFSISDDKLKELDLLQKICIKNKLNCIFLNGPIHEKVMTQSSEYLKHLKIRVQPQFKIKYLNEIFTYPKKYIGDSSDHIDVKYKNEVTRDYYNYLKQYIITN